MGEFYGKSNEAANPIFPEETTWEGPSKTICSPYGSAFEHDISGGNTFEDRLSNSGQVPGRATNSVDASRKMGEKRSKGGRY